MDLLCHAPVAELMQAKITQRVRAETDNMEQEFMAAVEACLEQLRSEAHVC